MKWTRPPIIPIKQKCMNCNSVFGFYREDYAYLLSSCPKCMKELHFP